MKPIPKRMLPNDVFYEAYKSDNGEGATFDTGVPLKFVKIEEKQQFNYTSNGREIVGNALLFYDFVNSTGLTKEPIPESKITFKYKVYKVVDADILRGNSNIPHHYEILLK